MENVRDTFALVVGYIPYPTFNSEIMQPVCAEALLPAPPAGGPLSHVSGFAPEQGCSP
jgi:hypothetical protein